MLLNHLQEDTDTVENHVPDAFCLPGVWQWESIDGSVCVPLPPPSIHSFVRQYDLCVTGDGLARLTCDPRLLHTLLPHVRVFARVSPKQKVRFQLSRCTMFPLKVICLVLSRLTLGNSHCLQ